MPEPVIYLDELSKTYVVPEREAGVMAAARSLVQRRNREIKAVDRVSFVVEPGEVVGFLGPNGAGKTTTLKMLAGLLHPTSGVGRVLAYEPWQRKRDFLKAITLVMGQRNQLNWDIPASDSFELNRVIYRVPQEQYRQTLGELNELLDLGPLISKPVRNLSLGERMKCEIAAALLHRPQVLFLDEPTIGLDVTAQRRIREFIQEYNRRHNATILLTSHYMADVEALCKRVVVIHHGRILFDGPLTELVKRFSPHKTITIELERHLDATDYSAFGEVVTQQNGQVTLRVPKVDTPKIAGRLLAELPVSDLTIEDPPIEAVIEQVFAQEAAP
ncbi:MAG: ATP-binding cassette domain-containing protein [Caldilineaceae bacterium]